MTLSNFLTSKALWLMALTLSVTGNPIDLPVRDSVSCDVVKCTATTSCVVVDGVAQCIGGDKCGPSICSAGTSCCNASCGVCLPPGMACTQQVCLGEPCGKNTCALGESCCNPSCGTCVPPDAGCGAVVCVEEPVICGNAICDAGDVCCNASCSICTPPGWACTQQVCGVLS